MRAPLLTTLVLLALVGLIFALWPALDLAASHLFYNAGAFVGHTPAGENARLLGWLVPFLVFALMVAGWLARRAGVAWTFLPNGLSIVYLAATLALGPGLIVNVALKNHWHRPRPVQTTEFGGDLPFRPWNALDGRCHSNCSFVSGEASSATWLLAPALLVPPPIRAAAIVGALAFGAAVGSLRMAFGGHFLSDTLISILLTVLVIVTGYGWLRRRTAKSEALASRKPS